MRLPTQLSSTNTSIYHNKFFFYLKRAIDFDAGGNSNSKNSKIDYAKILRDTLGCFYATSLFTKIFSIHFSHFSKTIPTITIILQTLQCYNLLHTTQDQLPQRPKWNIHGLIQWDKCIKEIHILKWNLPSNHMKEFMHVTISFKKINSFCSKLYELMIFDDMS